MTFLIAGLARFSHWHAHFHIMFFFRFSSPMPPSSARFHFLQPMQPLHYFLVSPFLADFAAMLSSAIFFSRRHRRFVSPRFFACCHAQFIEPLRFQMLPDSFRCFQLRACFLKRILIFSRHFLFIFDIHFFLRFFITISFFISPIGYAFIGFDFHFAWLLIIYSYCHAAFPPALMMPPHDASPARRFRWYFLSISFLHFDWFLFITCFSSMADISHLRFVSLSIIFFFAFFFSSFNAICFINILMLH